MQKILGSNGMTKTYLEVMENVWPAKTREQQEILGWLLRERDRSGD